MNNIQFTEHFNLDELLRSETATVRGFVEQYTPAEETVNNLRALCEKVLEPVRELVGVSVSVSSGYRCTRLNAAIGGEPTSQHLRGQAADIRAENLPAGKAGLGVETLYQKIKASPIAFDELIIENNGRGIYWVHVSYNPALTQQRGLCMKGVLLAQGGTECQPDGYGVFKNAKSV